MDPRNNTRFRWHRDERQQWIIFYKHWHKEEKGNISINPDRIEKKKKEIAWGKPRLWWREDSEWYFNLFWYSCLVNTISRWKKLIWLRKEVNLFRINMDFSLQFKEKEKRAKEAVNTWQLHDFINLYQTREKNQFFKTEIIILFWQYTGYRDKKWISNLVTALNLVEIKS